LSLDASGPRGADWADILEVLHALANTMTVRSHYTEGHPAIQRADGMAAQGFTRVLGRVPELVVALIDNEFVVCERPMPDLRARLHVLADAMLRHEIECLVFQRGMSATEAAFLGRMLARPPEQAGKVREQTQAGLQHVLLRFAELTHDHQWSRAGKHGTSFAPIVAELLAAIVKSIASDKPIDKKPVLAIATEMVDAVETRMFSLETRCYAGPDITEAGRHAANVALTAAAIALASDVPKGTAVDVAAAAMLHDVGHLLLPADVRCIPEPLLEEKAKPLFRNHTFAGASTLLASGCPPLWVAAALEHHRGIDGGGYPALESKSAPHELVRMIALANYYDRRRTILPNRAADDPDEAIRRAAALADRYFGRHLVTAFLKALGAFPPGTTVLLSTRDVAYVTHANPIDPWRPQVRLVTGPSAGKRVDLKEASALEGRHFASIVRAVPPPLLRPEEAAIVSPEHAQKKKQGADALDATPTPTPADAAIIAPTPRQSVPVVAVSGAERARQELADMGGVLDALLTIKTDALTHAPGRPMATSFVPAPPSAAPPAASAPPVPPSSAYIVPPPAPSSVPVAQPPLPKISAPPIAPSRPPLVSAPRTDDYPRPKPARSLPVPPPRASAPPATPSRPAFAAPPPKVSAPPPPSAAPPRMKTTSTAPQAFGATSRDSAASRAEGAYLRRLGSLAAIPRLVRPMQDLVLDQRSGFVCSFIDGASSIEDIIDVSGVPKLEVLRILDDLVAQGGISVE
jgi:HD-GYP domain-containing protein (c-di-GMP phosphodiesterase class II)